MKSPFLKFALPVVLLAALGFVLGGCGDDDDNPTIPDTTITTYDSVFGWDCETGVDCQDVFDIDFAAGSVVTIAATETTGGSVLQVALYAPGTDLGGTNLFTDGTTELRCNFVSGCTNNTAGQTVTDFTLADAGTYRLAITRDWGSSCGGDGTYRLQIDSDQGFEEPVQTVEDVATLATDWNCPDEDAMVYDEVFGWTCATGVACQDVFDIELSAATTLTLSTTEVTGGSVLQIALYAPGTALGGTNILTGNTDELRCNFVSGCTNNTGGQTVNDLTLTDAGIYRLAVTRDWGNSCGASGTYRLQLTADSPILSVTQSVEDVASTVGTWSCP